MKTDKARTPTPTPTPTFVATLIEKHWVTQDRYFWKVTNYIDPTPRPRLTKAKKP